MKDIADLIQRIAKKTINMKDFSVSTLLNIDSLPYLMLITASNVVIKHEFRRRPDVLMLI